MRKRLSAVIIVLAMLIGLICGCSIEIEDSYDQETQTTVTAEASEETSASETEETTTVTSASETEDTAASQEDTPSEEIDIDGVYTTMEDVSLYIYTYGCLPSNFMTKQEARDLGWEGGSLEPYAPGMCIGGDYFGNYEGLLPEEAGREYRECDINTLGASSRGAERLIYSNDGLIYYTEDHYESFTLIYGEP